ncbi:MAG: 2-amino-4-hydroxy-6-hydroxymethyldihydropteridine diphosphokinase [Methylophagaceae bacterium]
MSNTSSGYLLGIGSNIDPHNNIARIIALLLERFPQLNLSRVLKLPPIGMNSQHDFLNVVVFIETAIEQADLKAICNTIEIQLGRDRDDPTRKTKDRPADLDILTSIQFPDDAGRLVSDITDEYFLYPLLGEIKAYLSGKSPTQLPAGVDINLDGLTFGQAATTINRNA